jgi:predicted secreted protein
MALDAAQPSINTLLKLGNAGSPETFNTVANVGNIGGLTLSGNVVDVTSHSTGVPWRQKIVTLLDAGELTCQLFFIPAGGAPAGGVIGHDFTAGLGLVFTSRALRNYKLVFPDTGATTWSFSAYITKFSMTSPTPTVLEATVTFSATGQPTLA